MAQDSNIKLYFIDDDEAPHIYHRLMAIEAGYHEDQIERFFEVDKAITKIKSMIGSDDQSEWPDFIFVDINMPHKSGYDFVDEMKQIVPADIMPSIYFVSSSKNPNDIEKVKSMDLIKGFETKFLEPEFFMALGTKK